MSVEELFPRGPMASTVQLNPGCPRCGSSLNFIRQYKGTEVRSINRLSIVLGDDGKPLRVDVPDLGECDEDGYDEIISEKIVCGQECGFTVEQVGES